MRNILRFQMLVYLMAALLPVLGNSQSQYAYSSKKMYNNQPGLSSDQDKQTLLSALKELNKTKGVYFLFSEESIGNKLVLPVKNPNDNIEKILDDLLKDTGLTYKKVGTNTYVIVPDGEKIKTKKTLETAINITQEQDSKNIFSAPPIKGRITSPDGTPLSGVSVMIKGTTKGTTTNSNGEFSIDANRGEVLVITDIGYLKREYTVGGDEGVAVSLTPDPGQISENVVVTALGIKKESKRLGYAVSKVNGEEFSKAREINLGNALVGRVAGVNSTGQLTGPGGSSNVTIRGNVSLNGFSQPLYVVNGVPITNDQMGQAGMWGGADLGDALSSLNPDDIEEITVLKGGAAAALYGQLAKNGVIIITTKSGKGKNALGIELNSNVQIDRINNFLEFQDVYGQGTLGAKPANATSAMQTSLSAWGAKLDGSSVVGFDGQMRPYAAQGDNLARFYKTGTNFSNTLAISNGGDFGNYRFSISDLRNQSIYPNSKYYRNTADLNLNYRLSQKWSGQVNVNYAKEVGKNRTNLSDAPGNGNYAIFLLAPNVNADLLKPGYDATGNELRFNSDAFTTNPYFASAKFQNNTTRDRILATGSLRFSPFNWGYIQGRISNDFYAFNATQITPTGTAYRPTGSLDNQSTTLHSLLNADVLVGLNKSLANNLVTAGVTLGANLLKDKYHVEAINASGLAFPNLYNPSAATNRNASVATPKSEVHSVYGSLELSYKSFLFLNVTDRNDWSSTLPLQNNSYNYPSANLAYIFTENLKVPWLNYGKIRAGIAQIGNDAPPFSTLLYYNTNGSVNGQPLGSLGGTIPNNQLQPTKIREYEIGTELKMLNSRLSLDVAVYNKETLNDIVKGTVSQTSGYSDAFVNIGKIENKGIELQIGGTPINMRDFRWSSNFNFAYNKNNVKQLAEGQNDILKGDSRTQTGHIKHILGKPAYQVMVGDFKRDNKGNLVLNASGFPLSSDELVSAGNAVPPYTGGWNNDFSYKNVRLSFLVDYKFGAVIFSGLNARAYQSGLHKETLNGRETGISMTGVDANGNTITKTITAQQYYGALVANGISIVNTYSTDFIKLRSLALSYEFPARLFNNKVQGLSLSLVGRNLFYIKRDSPNIDPESNYSLIPGLEYGALPSTKSYGVNLNVKF